MSGANIELDEHALTITLNGTEKQCNHAIDYIDFIKQQRVGPVTIDMERSARRLHGIHGPRRLHRLRDGPQRPNFQNPWRRSGACSCSSRKLKGACHSAAKMMNGQRAIDARVIFGPLSCARSAGCRAQDHVRRGAQAPGLRVSSKGLSCIFGMWIETRCRAHGEKDEGVGASTPCR